MSVDCNRLSFFPAGSVFTFPVGSAECGGVLSHWNTGFDTSLTAGADCGGRGNVEALVAALSDFVLDLERWGRGVGMGLLLVSKLPDVLRDETFPTG